MIPKLEDLDPENAQRIVAATKELLATLETPIAGQPSIKVLHRRHAERLVAAAFFAVWEGVCNAKDPE